MKASEWKRLLNLARRRFAERPRITDSTGAISVLVRGRLIPLAMKRHSGPRTKQPS